MSCPLCQPNGATEIWRNHRFYVIDANHSEFPCFFRVISCRHITEMSELTAEERYELWEILNTIEIELIAKLQPIKINLAQFGNIVPHLHWHIIARWENDSHFPESPWGVQQRVMPATLFAERKAQTQAIYKHLADVLTAKFGIE